MTERSGHLEPAAQVTPAAVEPIRHLRKHLRWRLGSIALDMQVGLLGQGYSFPSYVALKLAHGVGLPPNVFLTSRRSFGLLSSHPGLRASTARRM